MSRQDRKTPEWIKRVMDDNNRELKLGEFRCGHCGEIMSSGDYECGGCGRGLMFFGVPTMPLSTLKENNPAIIPPQK